MKNKSISELEYLAEEEFSSYDGEGDEFSEYDGEGDDSLDFGGEGHNWFNVAERSFSYKITNANSSSRTAYILPGILWAPGKIASITAAFTGTEVSLTGDAQDITPAGTIACTNVYPNGFPRDGAFLDIDGNSGLTAECTDSSKTIEEFFAFIYANPTVISAIRIKTSDSDGAQLDNKITVRHQSPFRDMGSTPLTPADVQNQNTQQKDVAMFETPGFVAAKDVQAQLQIAGSQSTTITFYVGPIKNTTSEVKKKAARAHETYMFRKGRRK